MKKFVAILPMKANSERVRGKNFRDLNGKPLFRWILDTLLSVETIDQVIINTDAVEKFVDFGLGNNPRVLLRKRPPEICGDFVSMNKVIQDDIGAVESQAYLMTHATNPALSAASIQSAMNRYEQSVKEGYDSLFAVNKMQTRFYKADATPINHNPKELLRTQDLEPYFEENSNLYIFSRASFAKTNARIGERPVLFETPRIESIDIDDEEGWKIAEAITFYQTRGNK
jgi:CMP-N-acetylneuraminic acid synthetase